MIGEAVLHYRILQRLGAGGMGVVYLAEDTKLHRKVALKFLPQELASSPEERERLKSEARLAASLNHPNIATVYSIEEVGDELFLAMEYVQGSDLKEAIIKESWKDVSFEQKISYAIQIAEGLNAAHRQGIIHRDIKASNIVVTSDGYAKILDFGIARPLEAAQRTSTGQTPGTVAYMSPEQARGDRLDVRSDIWSFGVVLFELFTGNLPFSGKFEQAVYYSILHEKAKPIRRLVPSLPEDLELIIAKALEKNPDRRFQTSQEVLAELGRIAAAGQSARVAFFVRLASLLGRRWKLLAGGALAAIAIVAGGLVALNALQPAPAIGEINRRLSDMVDRGDFAAAFALASEHEARLQGDSTFAHLQLTIFDTLSLRSTPPGAEAVLRRIGRDGSSLSPDSILPGLTPRENIRVARGEYLLTLRKPGYVPAVRLASSAPILHLFPVPTRGLTIDVQLLDTSSAPPFMVPVPAGPYRLVNSRILIPDTVQLDEFLIDEHEVSNEEYLAFMHAGGYVRREFWKHPILIKGRTVPWEDAMRLFVDGTQLPGPRGWMGQNYPAGKGDHPVTGVTWYEAAAYAEFKGKSLPTLHQWEKASRNGRLNQMGLVLPWGLVQDSSENFRNRSNFESGGTTPVTEYVTGMSPYGCLNMAGNVREWLGTATSSGRLVTGGSFRDPFYTFSECADLPEAFSSEDLGFRCVKNRGDASKQGVRLVDMHKRIPTYRPLRGLGFTSCAAFYNYDRAPVSINSTSAEETPEWHKERVSFSGSDGENIIAYLFLPRLAAQPFQCIVFDPHSLVYAGIVQADRAAETILGAHIRAGRAVFIIVPKGSLQRPWSSGEPLPPLSSVLYRDRVVRWARDNMIGLDYLASRGDIDMRRIAFLVLSNEGGPLLIPALESRYRSVVLVGCGLPPEVMQNRPETNPVNFLPHYRGGSLVLNGRYDEIFPAEQCARPLYDLLPRPKKLELLMSGHAPPLDQRVPVINRWLDETLGPVQFPR